MLAENRRHAGNSRQVEAVMGKMAIFLFGFLALAIVIGALGTISPV